MTTLNKITNEQIERWQELEAKRQVDGAHLAVHAQRDEKRRSSQRPTFQTLGLHEQCGFFSFEDLAEETPGMLRWASDPAAIDQLAERVEAVNDGW